ncbi:hypothetical protein [Urbifossiella limnaea]|uniref:Uncharacterized protein n=1 Tax=Urbifossiella limnaea TaxID=2528023 RepID=A0A517XWD6_9BACT|nr:hypothetical protein [Urbifossiella limnaea]QDU21820.1 hypothetical protein ETAA1_37930 [Urbifossiella limnaea]
MPDPSFHTTRLGDPIDRIRAAASAARDRWAASHREVVACRSDHDRPTAPGTALPAA